MPITKSAKKAVTGSAKKKVFNTRRKNAVEREIKKLKKLIQDGKKDEALKHLSLVQKAIDKGAKRGIIKKNTASRKKSRLTKMINKS